jgi:hypothetical protein
MTFTQFIGKYDIPGLVVLLEGKRKVPIQDQHKLTAIGRSLASNTVYMTFRSGNAGGSDELFASGVSAVDPGRMEVVTPYAGHRKSANKSYRTYALDDLNLAAEPEVVRYSRTNKKTETLVEKYISGQRDRFAMKAAYIIRDTVKVLGAKGISPASFGIFYDDLSDPQSGGTGHTMNVCVLNNVPMVDQQIWFKWLPEHVIGKNN